MVEEHNDNNAFLKFLSEDYFRAEIVGIDKLDNVLGQNVLFAQNHAGFCPPFDHIIFDFLIKNYFKKNNIRINVKTISDDWAFNGIFKMSQEVIDYFGLVSIKKFDKSLTLKLKNNERFFYLISPEGISGIQKGFNNRYKLQKFKKGFVHIAKQLNLKIILVDVINSEFLTPFTYNSKTINRITNILFNLPFVPIGLMSVIILLFPFLVFWALPAKLIYVIHEPLNLNSWSEDNVDQLVNYLQHKHQAQLTESVSRYHRPYDLLEFFSKFLKSKYKIYYFPYMFYINFKKYFSELNVFNNLFIQLPILGLPLIYLFGFIHLRYKKNIKLDLKSN